ncbi:sirohydrochlorin chelatase [Nocardioides sp.]|uniref:sirohydrochlorin chelatase n=1 Tax=Nocardioides sp. TaxID=35761 RepID=UPI003D1488BC
MSRSARLVTVAHDTAALDDNAVARLITGQAARRLGRLASVSTYVGAGDPSFASVMRDNAAPAVVVPLMLSTGEQLRRRLALALDASRSPVLIARPLGPHPLLAEVMCRHLMAAGARRGDPVVMVAAASSDRDWPDDLRAMGAMLGQRWGAPVRVASVGGPGRQPVEAVAAARSDGRVAIVPYVLTPGHLDQRIRAIAAGLGVATVADVIGAHSLVSDLVVRRYRALVAARLAA